MNKKEETFHHLIYVCPKCHNTLLVSNQMLHDLRCTEENPATYEKVMNQQNQDNEYTPKKNNSLRFSSGLRKSNKDGTSSDIQKNIKLNGQEEYIETKYDAEGNIISRKKAENIDINDYEEENDDYPENTDFKEYDQYEESEDLKENFIENPNNNINFAQNNYYIEPTININNQQIIYTTTATPQEVIYEAPAKYDPNITINQPIEETVIASDGNLNDNVMKQILRNSITKGLNTQINNYGNISQNTNYNNYEQPTDINYINNINNGEINLNYGLDNEYMDRNMENNDILRQTAGFPNPNLTNIDYQF